MHKVNENLKKFKMGGLLSRLNGPLKSYSGSVTEIITGRKRKREDDDIDIGDEVSSMIGRSLNTPVK